jgi:putative ABC transport system permease protein
VRFADIVGLAFSALYQQKARTALTTLGVVIGSFVLLLSLSIGQGVRAVITEEWRRTDQLRRINVRPNYRPFAENIPAEEITVKGEMSDDRRERLRQALIRHWQGVPKQDTVKRLTSERLKELSAIPHVESVIPGIEFRGRIHFHDKNCPGNTFSVDANDIYIRQKLVAGSIFTADQPRGAVVTEYLLYQLGVIDEADMESVIGQTLRLEFSSQPNRFGNLVWQLGGEASPRLTPADDELLDKVVRQLPSAVARLDLTAAEKKTLANLLQRRKTSQKISPPVYFAEEFTITGVIRVATDKEMRESWEWMKENSDVFLPASTAAELYFRVPDNCEAGVNSAVVRVDSEDHVKEVNERIADMGLASFAPIEVLEQARFNVMMISLTTSFVALVALLVAGLGIANTLLMSVLERTHEIGVMKAVGARDRHIQLLFLLEGAWIGLLGSAVGLLGGWLASIPGDRLARRLAEQQTKTPFDHSLFVFPWWLVLGVPLFVTLLTMLAAVYPARRAARVNPMKALRHE